MAGWFGLSDGCKLTFSMWAPPDQSNQSRSPLITSRGPSSVFPPGFPASQTPGPAARLRESSNDSSKAFRSSRSDWSALDVCRELRLNSSLTMSNHVDADVNSW